LLLVLHVVVGGGTGWALIALGAGILGGIGAVIQGRASSTSHVDQAPPAAA
jgi:hypothetical protein